MSAHRSTHLTAVALAAALLVCSTALFAQAGKKAAKAPKDSTKIKAVKDTGQVAKFFQSSEVVTATLTTNLKRIRGDKSADSPWRAATLSYAAVAPDTGTVVIPARIKTRGIWRLKNCEMPPIRVNFTSKAVKGTVFRGQDEPKLTSYCKNNDDYEQYVLQEFQLYRIYRLLTPFSHAARLARLSYADSATGKVEATRYAFFLEEPTALATRVGAKLLKIKGAGPNDLEPYQDALVGVFEYMIGNTDFALGALHNAELLGMPMGDYYPVVFDFDFSGAVNARYATVDYRLSVKRVRDRLYRGYCVPPETYPKVFAQFNAKKDSIYALYKDHLGGLLKPDIVKETLEYFDDFYKTINNPKAAKGDIIDQCLGKK